MPRREDLTTILILGSGPIVIGQACEFDYSGTQACKALLEEGYRVVLVNSNPATIMTDPGMADRTYIEPITWEAIEKIIAIERPDGTRVPIPPERRAEVLETALWPFRPVVALRPLTGGRRSVMTISADVPTGSRLQTAVGVHPKRWFKYPPARVTFQIWAVDGGERTLLRTRTINPQGDHRDRHWFEIDVPLDAHAGRRIDLEFTTETNRTDAEIFEMGGWAIPRLSRPRLPGHDPLIRGLEAELRPQRIHDHEDRQQQRVLEVEEAHEPVGESPVQEAVVQ